MVDVLQMHSVQSIFMLGSVTPQAANMINKRNAKVTRLRHKFRTYNIPDSFPVIIVPLDLQHTPVMSSECVAYMLSLVAMYTSQTLMLL